MKKVNSAKKQKQSVRQLISKINILQSNISNQETALYNRDAMITKQRSDISDLQGQLREQRETTRRLTCINEERLKAIGYYFSAVDAEFPTSEESREYLRSLRARIFEYLQTTPPPTLSSGLLTNLPVKLTRERFSLRSKGVINLDGVWRVLISVIY